jgi:hypothetical protein
VPAEDNHLMPAAVKSAGEKRADVTGAARNDDLHDELTAIPGGA